MTSDTKRHANCRVSESCNYREKERERDSVFVCACVSVWMYEFFSLHFDCGSIVDHSYELYALVGRPRGAFTNVCE